MRVFITVLVLIFSLQSWTKADDISDFEIEGISVGDSLLEFFDELDLTVQIIKDYPKYIYPGSKKFYGLRINKKLGEYDHFSVMLKKNDEKYIIHSLRGKKVFDNNIEGCKKYKKKVVDNLKDFLTNVKQSDYIHKYKRDEGKSVSYITDFHFKNGSSIRAYCDNWSTITEKKNRWKDSLAIEISTAEALNWINNEANK